MFDMAALKQRKVDGERRVFQDRSVGLHSTEKEFLCVSLLGNNTDYSFSIYRLSLGT